MRTAAVFIALLNVQALAAGAPACGSMATELKRMRDVDQAVRALIQPEDLVTSEKNATEPPKSFQRILLIDKQHEATLKGLIRRCGWPKRSVHGEEVTGAEWILVQHTAPNVQKEFLPFIYRAFAAQEVPGSDLAYLTDRVRLNSGLKQLFGTQLNIKPPCQVSTMPIEDAAGVDSRRERMKMPPLGVYLKQVRQHFAEQGCAQQ